MPLVVPALKRLSPAFKSTHQCESRGLVRALLRQCTYLPDSLARRQIARQILARSRVAKAKGDKALRIAIDPEQPSFARSRALFELGALQKKGHVGLRILNRANDGELKPLYKVLYAAYGRSGRRRHELLAPLLQPDEIQSEPRETESEPRDEEAFEPMRWDLSTVQVPDVFEPPTIVDGKTIVVKISRRYSRLRAILNTQVQTALPSGALTELKEAGFRMPAKNSWGRSMPRRRVRNMARKKRTRVLSRALPPLPIEDWEHLRRLIASKASWEGQPRRRTPVAQMPEALTSFDVETLLRLQDAGGHEQYLQNVAREARISSSAFTDVVAKAPLQRHLKSVDRWLFQPERLNEANIQLLEDTIQLRHLNKRTSKLVARGHQIRYKFMRGLWIKVFQQCPVLQPNGGAWRVNWGEPPESVKPDLMSFKMLFDYKRVSTPHEVPEEATAVNATLAAG